MELKVLRLSLGGTMIDSIRTEYISRKAQQVGKGEMVLTSLTSLLRSTGYVLKKMDGWKHG